MKKKSIILIFLFVCLTFVFMGNICAADINSFTIDVEASTGNAGSGLNMKVNGRFDQNTNYYVKFTNEGDPKPSDFPSNWHESISSDKDDIKVWKAIVPSSLGDYGNLSISDDWYLLKDYDNAYILECNSDSCKVSDKPIKVNRPPLPELTKRYQLFLFKDDLELSIFPYFPYMGKNGSHQINLKVGIINDRDLLYRLYKSENGALTDLTEYAKNNSGTSFSCDDMDCSNVKLDNLSLSNGSYYYIYTNYKNDDGMYRDLSDISLAQATHNVLSNDINWDFNENVQDQNIKVKNPKTKDENIILIALFLTVTTLILILSVKKLKKVSK